MTELALTIACCCAVTLIGYGLLAPIARLKDGLLSIALAPIAGVAALTLCGQALSRVGIPAAVYAWPTVAALGASALVLAMTHRSALRPKTLAVWAAFAACASVLPFAGPFVHFGADWFGYVNMDVTNPMFLASHLQRHGGFVADIPSILNDSNFSSVEYIAYSSQQGLRSGIPSVMAIAAQIFGRTVPSITMPFIALGLFCLVLASAALVSFKGVWASALCALGVAVSPMTLWGAFNLHLEQLFGMALLVASAVLLDTLLSRELPFRRALVLAVSCAATAAALLEAYPELLSVFALYVAARSVLAMRWPGSLRDVGRKLALTLVVALALLNGYVLALPYDFTAIGNLPGGFREFLLPTGPANFWGLLPLSVGGPVLVLAAGTLLSVVLSIFAVRGGVALFKRGSYVSPLLGGAFVAAALYFVFKHNGYGLLKLAMYAQPFAIGCVVGNALRMSRPATVLPLRRGPVLALACFVAALALVYRTASFYEMRSNDPRGETSGTYASLRHFGPDHLLSHVHALLKDRPGPVFVDTLSDNMARFVAATTPDTRLLFSGYDPVRDLTNMGVRQGGPEVRALAARRLSNFGAHELANCVTLLHRECRFTLDRRASSAMARENPGVLMFGPYESVFNRATFGALRRPALLDWRSVSDLAVFIPSTLGVPSSSSSRMAIETVTEPDFFKPSGTMVALGRYLLLEILRPTASVRLEVALSTSLLRPIDTVPEVRLMGENVVRCVVAGRGAARLVSPPVRPVFVDGRAFVVVDIGRTAVQRHSPYISSFARWLLGGAVEDERFISVFARDISISDGAREQPTITPSIASFPNDLLARDVTFSGVYEDGWLSRDAFVRLRNPGGALAIRGMIPLIADPAYTSQLNVFVDGRRVLTRALGLGTFDVEVPASPGTHTVALRFQRDQVLPKGDDRPVAALASFIGFHPPER